MKENGEQCLFIRMKPSTKVAPTMAWLNLKLWKTVKDFGNEGMCCSRESNKKYGLIK